jgi:hypothetical protein
VEGGERERKARRPRRRGSGAAWVMEEKRGMDLNVTVAKGGREVDKPAEGVETFPQLSTSLAKASSRKDQLSTCCGKEVGKISVEVETLGMEVETISSWVENKPR